MSPTQLMEIMAWWRAKKALGSTKSKARELGIAPGKLQSIIMRERFRQRGLNSRGEKRTYRNVERANS